MVSGVSAEPEVRKQPLARNCKIKAIQSYKLKYMVTQLHKVEAHKHMGEKYNIQFKMNA